MSVQDAKRWLNEAESARARGCRETHDTAQNAAIREVIVSVEQAWIEINSINAERSGAT